MNKKIFLGLICLYMLILPAVSMAEDKPVNIFESIQVDKVSHLGVGFILSHVMQQGWGWKPAQAFAGVATVAIAKEYFDYSIGNKFDCWDLGFTLLGWVGYNSINVRYTW